jgi:DNA-binding transcriptional LysR family regulator
LRLVLEDWTTPAGGVHVVYPSSQHLSPLVRAFIELAAKRIGATDIFEND